MCLAQELGSYAQGQGHNCAEANLMKLHRKIKHNENVCRTHDLDSYTQGQGRNQVRGQNLQRSKSCLSNNSTITEANLTKLHRRIEHNEKLCRAQDLDSCAQGQGHTQVKGQIVPKTIQKMAMAKPR